MTRLSEKDALYFELYSALAHFIGQQQLVVRAVLDQGVSPEALKRGVAGWYDKIPQRGQWGDWQFMFHGGGCTLVHPVTGEVIRWNGPDPLSFDPYFFLDHLQWRFQHGLKLPHLSEFVERNGFRAIVSLINELVADELISPDYVLIRSTGGSQASAA